MKTEYYNGKVSINIKTDTHGGSSMIVSNDERTDVYYGNLHAAVRFKDLNLEIIMNSEPGEWQSTAWARKKALQELKKKLTLSGLVELIQKVQKAGEELGNYRTKYKIRQVLGISENSLF